MLTDPNGPEIVFAVAEPSGCECVRDEDGLIDAPCVEHARNQWRMDDLVARLLDAELDERIRKHTRPVAVLGQGV